MKILVTAAQVTYPSGDADDPVAYASLGAVVDVDDKVGGKLVKLGVAVDTDTQSMPVQTPKPAAPAAPAAKPVEVTSTP